MKRVITFTLGVDRASIEIEIRPMQNTGRTVDLEPIPAGALELSMMGTFDGGGGQVVDSIAEAAGEHDAADVARLCQIWTRWHLNGMKAGTRRQSEALAEAPIDAPGYEFAKAFLSECGLDPDVQTAPERVTDGLGNIKIKGYAYGSSWLAEPLPADIEAEVWRLADRIQGQRYGAEVTADDLEDLPEVDESADFINSRDVRQRLAGFEAFLADIPEADRTPQTYDPETDPHGDRSDEVEEYAELKALDEAGEQYAGDWEYGESMIADDHFEEYAQELAEDIGAVNAEAKWPNNHIDWSAAAEELKGDYTAIEFRGKTFWVR